MVAQFAAQDDLEGSGEHAEFPDEDREPILRLQIENRGSPYWKALSVGCGNSGYAPPPTRSASGTRKGADAGRQADKIIARAKGTVTCPEQLSARRRKVGIFWVVQTPEAEPRLLAAGCPLDAMSFISLPLCRTLKHSRSGPLGHRQPDGAHRLPEIA
jgi:hypothetical protein